MMKGVLYVVEISSKPYSSRNGKRLYKRSSIVIHLFKSSKMLAVMARINEIFATSMEIGGRGKPSSITANDSSQSGSKLARVVLQERGSAQLISFAYSISFTFLLNPMLRSASLSVSCFSKPIIGGLLVITDIGRVDPDSVSTMSSADMYASGSDIRPSHSRRSKTGPPQGNARRYN